MSLLNRRWLASGSLILLLAIAFPVQADEWLPAKTETYSSQNHLFRLTVIPRDISSPLAYFEDTVKNRKLAGQAPTGPNKSPRGILEQLGRNGRWNTLWRRRLINDVAPVSAVVSDDGRYAVTFDNWHSMGWGNDAVVIYGPNGQLVRALALEDFLPDYYVHALPHSVTSIWWSGKHTISGDSRMLILKVVVPDAKDPFSEHSTYTDMQIDLATGDPLAATETWRQVLAKASVAATAQQRAEAAHERWLSEPLLGPTSADESEWHSYLEETFFRLAPDWKDNYPGKTILRSPEAPDYAPSEQWVRDALLEKELPADVLMFASPASPENLIRVFERIVPDVKPDALRKARIYVAIPARFAERVNSVLAPTGAKVIILDPAKPIPQRKERLHQ